MMTTEIQTAMNLITAAIIHPDYSHSRRGDGCWRDVVWLYHRDPMSPSGFKLAASGDASIVEPMLRDLVNNSPLSPAER